MEQARKLYAKGLKLIEIAGTLGVPEGTVRSWKNRYDWDNATLQKNKRNVAKKKGGQPGNKNAEGHGGTGPPGNKNAIKTGEFEALFFDCLDPEEQRLAQAVPEDARRLEEADIILGTSNRKRLVPDLLAFLSARQRIIDIAPHTNDEKFENLNVENFTGRTRAFVKIEDGCNRFCSYCIIPYARGRVRSKPLEDLKAELAGLGANGYKEVVLTGINLSAYGQEFGLHLCDAIEAACATPGIERVRLGSLEPEQLSEDVIRRMAKQKKLCPQFHLSLQSGCDATLKRMNRHYTADEYRTIVRNLRAAFENAAITTDIMVGFAGETDEEFAESLAFAEEIAFAKVHVFAYSRRPGTRAYDMGDQLTNAVKEARSPEMIRVTTATQQAFFKAQIGRTEEVLFEREIQKGVWEGYSMNYTPVAVASGTSLAGEIRSVRIESCTDTHCMGVVL